MAKSKKTQVPKDTKDIVIPDPDNEEIHLSKLVFGDQSGFEQNLKQVDNLYSYDSDDSQSNENGSNGLFVYDDSSDEEQDEYLSGFKNKDNESTEDEEDDDDKADEGNEMEGLNDDELFFVDESDDDEDKMQIDSVDEGERDSESDSESEDDDAWADSDDEKLEISLLSSDKLRKLRKTEQDDKIRGSKYILRLRSQFERIYPRPEWADSFESDQIGDENNDDVDDVDDDNEDNNGRSTSDVLTSSNPLLQFLKTNQPYSKKGEQKLLQPHKLDISRLTDANHKKLSRSAIQSLSFHSTHPLLLTGGYDRTLRVYHIDGKVNNLVTSLHLRQSPIQTACFVKDGGIMAGGRRRYMYKWDVSGGSIEKISRLYGHEKTQRSFENFKVSNNGLYLGLIGNSGWINVLNARTGQWVKGFKVEGTLVDFDFSKTNTEKDDVFLVAVNSAGEVWEFNVDTGKILAKWTDESGLGVTKVKLGGIGNRWLAIGNNVGIVNVYDRLKTSGVPGANPKPVGVIENLVNTISSIDFTNDGQVMCIASRDKKDALRLIHLPTCKVFSNWPTSNTPLGKVTSICFSPGGEMLATGNEAGRVRLWRLNHY